MGGAEEGSQRRRGRRRGEKIVQIIRSDGRKTVYAGKKHERTEMPCLLSICRSAIVHGPRDLVLRLKPPALLEKSRYPSKDSQLSSHSITRSLLSSVSVIAVSTKATHREIRSPLYAVRIKQPTKKKRNPLTLAIVASAVEAAIPRRRRVTAGYNANTLFNYSAPTFAINLEIDRGPIAGLA